MKILLGRFRTVERSGSEGDIDAVHDLELVFLKVIRLSKNTKAIDH